MGRRALPGRLFLRRRRRAWHHDLAGLHVRRRGTAIRRGVPREHPAGGDRAGQAAARSPQSRVVVRQQRSADRLGKLGRPGQVQAVGGPGRTHPHRTRHDHLVRHRVPRSGGHLRQRCAVLGHLAGHRFRWRGRPDQRWRHALLEGVGRPCPAGHRIPQRHPALHVRVRPAVVPRYAHRACICRARRHGPGIAGDARASEVRQGQRQQAADALHPPRIRRAQGFRKLRLPEPADAGRRHQHRGLSSARLAPAVDGFAVLAAQRCVAGCVVVQRGLLRPLEGAALPCTPLLRSGNDRRVAQRQGPDRGVAGVRPHHPADGTLAHAGDGHGWQGAEQARGKSQRQRAEQPTRGQLQRQAIAGQRRSQAHLRGVRAAGRRHVAVA